MTRQVMSDGDLILGLDTNARFATTTTETTMFTERSVQSVLVFILRDEASYTICHKRTRVSGDLSTLA